MLACKVCRSVSYSANTLVSILARAVVYAVSEDVGTSPSGGKFRRPRRRYGEAKGPAEWEQYGCREHAVP